MKRSTILAAMFVAMLTTSFTSAQTSPNGSPSSSIGIDEPEMPDDVAFVLPVDESGIFSIVYGPIPSGLSPDATYSFKVSDSFGTSEFPAEIDFETMEFSVIAPSEFLLSSTGELWGNSGVIASYVVYEDPAVVTHEKKYRKVKLADAIAANGGAGADAGQAGENTIATDRTKTFLLMNWEFDISAGTVTTTKDPIKFPAATNGEIDVLTSTELIEVKTGKTKNNKLPKPAQVDGHLACCVHHNKDYVVCVDHNAVTPKEAQDFIDEHDNHGVTITVERWDWDTGTKVGQVPKEE